MRVAPPYTILADHYDREYADFRKSPLAMVRPLLKDPLKDARSVCDLACGTGVFARELATRGLRVVGVDSSAAMLKAARRAGPGLKFVRGDMRRYASRERFDLVTCFFDSLNHLQRHGDLKRVFHCASRLLRPGGWFAFDVNTEAGVKLCWPDPPDAVQGVLDGCRFWRIARGLAYDARRRRGGVQIDWLVERRKGSFRHTREVYYEIAWGEREVRAALGAAGFGAIETVDGSVLERRTARGLRTYYRARRI